MSAASNRGSILVLDPNNPNDLLERLWAVVNAAANAEAHMVATNVGDDTHLSLPIGEWLPVVTALERVGRA